jgi:nitroreductase
MEIKEAIEKRRSIRKYLDKEISRDVVDELIEAARLAPSARNSQTWKFKIVEDKKVISNLKEAGAFHQDFVYRAPLIIICCADPNAYPVKSSIISATERVITDLAIASEHIVLRAVELGLGSCYIGLLDEKKLKKELEIPEDYVLHYALAIGYPDGEGSVTDRKSREEILI